MPNQSIKATIRDFPVNHPDFETDRFTGAVTGLNGEPELGIVKATLKDGKPQYNGDPEKGTKTTSGKNAFDQWYGVVPGNYKTINGYSLELQQIGEVDYKFESNAFFPLDEYKGKKETFGTLYEQIFDSQGGVIPVAEEAIKDNIGVQMQPHEAPLTRENLIARFQDERAKKHNYLFTVEAEVSFTYLPKDNKGNLKEYYFKFAGDDDLWVFIDGKLVIDLGGLHESRSKQINLSLNNPKNRASNKFNTLKLNLKEDLGIAHAESYLDLVLEEGKEYQLKIFYAERHTFDSNCCVYTSLPPFKQPPEPDLHLLQVQIDAIKDAIEPFVIESLYSKPGVSGQFKISLNEPAPAGGIKVKYELVSPNPSKTAIEKVDFNLSPPMHEVFIPEGKTSALIDVIPLPDKISDDKEEVVAKLIQYPGSRYELGDQVQDTVYIRDFAPQLERVVCVAPVRTIIRREEEIVLVRRIRKVEEIDASPACPTNTSKL